MVQSSPQVYTVSEFNRQAQRLLEEAFAEVWIEGEISNFRGASSSGHCYFSLKDQGAQIDVVAFRGVMAGLRFRLEDGLKVLVLGRASLYPQRGRFQIVAGLIEPKGAGALQIAFEQLKKKLESEGLFDPARKKPIPSLPQKVGIVTSPTGAAIRDMLSVIERRFANVEILIYPVKVQGEGAKEEIAAAVSYLNANHPDLDVLLVGRGGGSIEDLWAFNEESVARAIAASMIPVISCVGHEIDFTIADFVADLRAPTPSAAAELVVRNKSELVQHLCGLEARLRQNLQSGLQFAEHRLASLARCPLLARPADFLEEKAQGLDELLEKLGGCFAAGVQDRRHRLNLLQSKIALLSPAAQLEEKRNRLSVLAAKLARELEQKRRILQEVLLSRAGRLQALSPLAVLARGYAICRSADDGNILKSAAQVRKSDPIRVTLHEGEIRAVVQEAMP